MNKLFTCLGWVRIVKNCDLGLENAALGLRRRAAFSRPQPANEIYLCDILKIRRMLHFVVATIMDL